MDAQAVGEQVRQIVVEQLSVKEEAVKPEARFAEDLGADSLDTMELVMAFEEAFGLEIPDEDAQKVTTVGEATQYIKEKWNRVQAGEAVR